MHPVEADPKVRDPRARALAGLKVGEPSTAVLIESAQGVEFGMETGPNHAAVPNLRTGLVGQLRPEQARR